MFKIDEFEAKYETVQKSEDQICKKKRRRLGHIHIEYILSTLRGSLQRGTCLLLNQFSCMIVFFSSVGGSGTRHRDDKYIQ